MPRPARISETFNLIALALWLGALFGAGASAAIIFPAMKSLSPTLPDFAAWPGEHWKIAGGTVANRMFVLCDFVQFAAACLCVLSLIVSRIAGSPVASRAAYAMRLLFLSIAWLLVAYELFVLAPRMQDNLSHFWAAAKAGDAAASGFQSAFDADHPTASRVLAGTALAVLATLVASAWGLTPPKETAR